MGCILASFAGQTIMRTAFFALSFTLLLTACDVRGTDQMRDYLSRDGDWGWSGGAGCVDDAHLWRIDGDMIEVFRDGRLVDRAMLERRRMLYENRLESGSGPLEFTEWIFIAQNPHDRSQMGRHEMMFAIRGGPGRPTALAPRNRRTFTEAETGNQSRIDDPNAGDRLVHCVEYAAFQG